MDKRIILAFLFSALFFTSINSALIHASFNKASNVNFKSVTASPNTIWVRDNYTTIQAAIDAASPGDTIRVRAGTYNESITINKNNLRLIGESRENTIIDGRGLGYVVNVMGVNNITFSGFTVRNGDSGIWLWNSNNNNFTDNAVSSNNQYGIYLLRSSNNNFSGNTASNNQYGIYIDYSGNNVLSGNSASNNGYGIYIDNSDNNLLSGNTASNNSQYGINLEDSDYNNLTKNAVSSNNIYGIILYHSSSVILSGNIASNNIHGIYVGDSGNNVLSGNTVLNNTYGIHFYYSGNNVLSGNTVLNNTYGIRLYNSGDNVLSGNTASNNQYAIYLWGSSNNMISHSNFITNTGSVSSIGSVNSWDNGVEGNYWSDYDGADANRDGIGDTPYPIDEDNRDNYPLMAMFLQFNIETEDGSYKIDVVCNSMISNFYVYLGINALSFKASGAQGKGFCRICIPHALIQPPYTVTVDYNPPLYSKIVHTNGTHTWLYFTYEHTEHEIIIMHMSSPEQSVFWSQLAILGLAAMTAVLLSISIRYYRLFRGQRKVIQAYEGELGSFPVNHSERARARFIRDVIERKEKIEKFKKKYGVKVHPASTLKELMEKLGVKKEKEKS